MGHVHSITCDWSIYVAATIAASILLAVPAIWIFWALQWGFRRLIPAKVLAG